MYSKFNCKMKHLLFSLMLLSCAICQAQTSDDPVLMTIKGVPVLRSEFEFSYNKNKSDKMSVEEYAELFINFKLKVRAAIDARLDKAKSFQDEFHTYRDSLIRSYLVPKDVLEGECRLYYDNMLVRLEGKQLLQPAHILIMVNKDASEEDRSRAELRIDSVYRALKDGADFAELAKLVSQDPGTAGRGGILPWIGPNQVVKEFEDVAYSLKVGEISKPFLMSYGYDIIKLIGRKDLESYEELHNMIEDYLTKQKLDSLANQEKKTVEQILDEKAKELCAKDVELKYIIQEYHDGLLLWEISNQQIWNKTTDVNQQTKLELQWVGELRKKYTYTINSTVLATVNNHSRQNEIHQNHLFASNQSQPHQTTKIQPKAQPQNGIDLVDVGIPVSNYVNKNTFAIIVANEDYQSETKVDYAKNDGETVKNYCYKTLGLPEKNVHFVANATLNNLIGELDWLKQVCDAFGGDASVIFYYAGHGIPEEASGSAYLLPIDGNSRILRTCFSINELYETLGKMPAKQVTVLMDACFSGAKRDGNMLASARGVAIKAKAGAPKGNMIVMSAAQGDETAYKYEETGHGLFTYFLLKKLKETKGNVTMGELSQYVQDQVKRYSIVENGKSQTPSVQTSDKLRDNWKSLNLY